MLFCNDYPDFKLSKFAPVLTQLSTELVQRQISIKEQLKFKQKDTQHNYSHFTKQSVQLFCLFLSLPWLLDRLLLGKGGQTTTRWWPDFFLSPNSSLRHHCEREVKRFNVNALHFSMNKGSNRFTNEQNTYAKVLCTFACILNCTYSHFQSLPKQNNTLYERFIVKKTDFMHHLSIGLCGFLNNAIRHFV